MAEKTIDVAQESSVQEVNQKIGSTGDTSGSTTAGSLFAKLNAILTNWTSTRAGYIDTIKTNTDNIYAKVDTEVASAVSNTATNNTASKTGVLSAKLAYVISLLENTTYGLSAIKSNSGAVKSVQRGTVSSSTSSKKYDDNFKVWSSGTSHYGGIYIDITISSINMSKSFVLLETYAEGDKADNFIPVITSSTNLRIYYNSISGTPDNAIQMDRGVSWQVIEFK
jgi:hypothetical protein